MNPPQVPAPARRRVDIRPFPFLVRRRKVEPSIVCRDNSRVNLYLPLSLGVQRNILQLVEYCAPIMPDVHIGLVFEQVGALSVGTSGDPDPNMSANITARCAPNTRSVFKRRQPQLAHLRRPERVPRRG